LYGLYTIVAIGVRVWLQRRRTGSTGFKAVREKPFSIAWVAAMVLGLSALSGVTGAILDVAGIIQPFPCLDSGLGHVMGVLISLSGLAVVFYSQMAMGDSWRIGVDRDERPELVTRGPFGVVRNPIFSAMTVMAIGLLLVLPNLMMVCSLA